jgi:magnesium chelatase subunit I
MPQPRTLGELRRTQYRPRTVKEELRANCLRHLRNRQPLFPGVIGYDRTVIPELVNALLSRHDFILLGLRGQAKTRLVRGLVQFLDAEVPAVEGSPFHDDPLNPVSAVGRRIVGEAGDDTPLIWVGPTDRFLEKLATPDVTIADLIGDVDPIKAANEGRHLDDEEIIQYGLVPRAHRGIFAINELPDLAPRIQVGLLNIMEEKDVQIRGFPVRLPIDLLMVFTANPEDYTSRGSIITPLKDRIDSQIHTHYPAELEEAMTITDQESWLDRDLPVHIPGFLRRVIDEVVFLARESEYVDHSSGVSARASIAAYENVLSNVERRGALHGSSSAVVRVCDLNSIIPALVGKVELAYEGEQEGAVTICRNLVGKAILRSFLQSFPDPRARSGRRQRTALDENESETPPRTELDTSVYGEIISWFGQGGKVELSDLQSEDEYRQELEQVPGLAELVDKHMAPSERDLAPAMEMVLEGLFQNSFVAKENLDRGTLYSDMLMRMMEGMGRASD